MLSLPLVAVTSTTIGLPPVRSTSTSTTEIEPLVRCEIHAFAFAATLEQLPSATPLIPPMSPAPGALLDVAAALASARFWASRLASAAASGDGDGDGDDEFASPAAEAELAAAILRAWSSVSVKGSNDSDGDWLTGAIPILSTPPFSFAAISGPVPTST